MSSETRTIRPYLGGGEFQSVLDRCRLQIGDLRLDGGGRVSVSLDEYLNYQYRLVLAADDHDLHAAQAEIAEGLGSLGLATSDVEFLVLASSPTLKMVDVVARVPLDELPEIPRVVAITGDSRPRALLGPNGGCDIRVYFCLARQLPPRALHPWRKGTWLGKQEFSVRSELGGVGFVPVRLDDDLRDDLGLDRSTVRYVAVDDSASTLDPDAPADAVKVYVDADLLDRLGVNSRTPVGIELQRRLFLDAATAVVMASIRELHADPTLGHADVDEFKGGLLHGLIEMTAGRDTDGPGNRARNAAFRLMQDDPGRFLARIDARVGSRRDVLEIFEDHS